MRWGGGGWQKNTPPLSCIIVFLLNFQILQVLTKIASKKDVSQNDG